jgi:hypothetical protein
MEICKCSSTTVEKAKTFDFKSFWNLCKNCAFLGIFLILIEFQIDIRKHYCSNRDSLGLRGFKIVDFITHIFENTEACLVSVEA